MEQILKESKISGLKRVFFYDVNEEAIGSDFNRAIFVHAIDMNGIIHEDMLQNYENPVEVKKIEVVKNTEANEKANKPEEFQETISVVGYLEEDVVVEVKEQGMTKFTMILKNTNETGERDESKGDHTSSEYDWTNQPEDPINYDEITDVEFEQKYEQVDPDLKKEIVERFTNAYKGTMPPFNLFMEEGRPAKDINEATTLIELLNVVMERVREQEREALNDKLIEELNRILRNE